MNSNFNKSKSSRHFSTVDKVNLGMINFLPESRSSEVACEPASVPELRTPMRMALSRGSTSVVDTEATGRSTTTMVELGTFC